MSDTAVRYVRMLELIPGAPRRIAARDLLTRLDEEGFSVDLRTIQRDLDKLSAYFPLTHDGATPRGWSWMKDARVTELPAMSPATALAFLLLNEFSRPLLPNNMRSFLDQHLERARSILDEVSDRQPGLSEWSELVAVTSRNQPLLPPEGDQDAIRVAYDALLKGLRFQAIYHAASRDGEGREYDINPLGLILRDHLLYLACTLSDYEDVRLLALHRMEQARLLDDKAWRPDGFDLHEYVDSGMLDIVEGPEIELVADFDTQAARHLSETPLHREQILEQRSDHITRVRARVQNTKQLRWWLQGFGAAVEVIRPQSLREEMATTARALAARYE